MKKIQIKFRKLVCASLFIIGYTIQVEAQTNEYFKTTWNTEEGDPNGTTIVLPIKDGAYDVDVNNDGDFDDTVDLIDQSGPITINFQSPGIYTIAVRPNPTNNLSKRLRISQYQTNAEPLKLKSIDKWGTIVWTTMNSAFDGCANMTLADDAGVPDLSVIKDLNYAFQGATRFNGNLSSWDVSNATNMRNIFRDATSFNSDISSWNVSNVSSMSHAFRNASNFNSDLGSWNVSSVEFMTKMFTDATSFSAENYDALLTGWSGLPSLLNDVEFQAPPQTYCSGKAGRNILIGTYNWTILGDRGEDCSAVTSVDDEFLSNTKIYPNPTGGKINIESSFEIDKLELYNVLGAKLFSVSKTNVLDLTSLSQGIYILKVFSGDRVFAKKLVKD